jgi:hypothetical protein
MKIPKKVFAMSKSEQEDWFTNKMQEYNVLADYCKKLAQQARKKKIEEPKEIDRPDEQLLKDGI